MLHIIFYIYDINLCKIHSPLWFHICHLKVLCSGLHVAGRVWGIAKDFRLPQHRSNSQHSKEKLINSYKFIVNMMQFNALSRFLLIIWSKQTPKYSLAWKICGGSAFSCPDRCRISLSSAPSVVISKHKDNYDKNISI